LGEGPTTHLKKNTACYETSQRASDLYGDVEGPVAGPREHGNEHSGFIKGGCMDLVSIICSVPDYLKERLLTKYVR